MRLIHSKEQVFKDESLYIWNSQNTYAEGMFYTSNRMGGVTVFIL